MIEEIKDYAIEGLEKLKGQNPECADVHHEIFNMDYYIIGTYKAKEWIIKGEEILYESKTYDKLYDKKLGDEDLQQIINELN